MVTTQLANGHAAEPVPDAALVRATGLMPVIPIEHDRQAMRVSRATSQRAIDPPARTQLVPGRQTGAAWPGVLGSFGWSVIPRRGYRGLNLQHLNLARMQPHQVMDILADISPDVSLALHNMLLMTNSGYTIEAMTASGETDAEGQRILDELIGRLNARGGGLDAIIDQLHYSVFLHGAEAAEIVLTAGLRDVEDIYPVAPWTIQFVQDTPYPRPQQQTPTDAKPRELNQATFWYLPLMPAVDDPYGRMPFASVLYPLHFDLQLLYDLQVAVHSNAWDRLDVTILESVVTAAMPEQDRDNPEARARWVNAVVSDVREGLNTIRPDDNFIHTDGTTIKPVTSGNRSVGIVPVFRMLERRIIRALKQLPILMGSNEGTTETHGTIQFEIWVDGLRAVQQRTRDMLEGMFTLALEVHGRQSHARMTWDAIRTTDRAKDAQAEAVEIANEIAKRDQGWITQDDASQAITGSAAVSDAPTITTSPADASDDDADRVTRIRRLRASQTRALGDDAAFRDIERDVRRLIRAYFTAQRAAFPADEIAQSLYDLFAVEATNARVSGQRLAPSRVLPHVARWFQSEAAFRLATAFVDDLVEAFRSGWNAIAGRVFAALGIGGAFDLTNPTILDGLASYSGRRVSGFDDESARRLSVLVARELEGGAGVSQLASMILGEFTEMTQARADLIAVSEAASHHALVRQETLTRNGITEWTWQAVLDDATCEACRGNDGETRLIGDTFKSGHMRPTVHPRCRCDCVEVVPADYENDSPWAGE